MWVGPQDEWWSHQDVTEDHWGAWPPDPYLVAAEYRIEEADQDRIVLKGPASPITGVSLRKEVHLGPDGRVTLRTHARNERDTEISWDLWSNTRLPAHAASYVHVKNRNDIRIDFDPEEPETVGMMPRDIVNGFFTFMPYKGIPAGKEKCIAKAFIHPSAGVIAAFPPGYCFIKHTEMVPRNSIHPKQAMAEVFNQLGSDTPLLELEFHGPYCTMKPGEVIVFEETWQLIPYSGENTPEVHTAFLKKQLNGL
jgi:hypothetical protein